MGCPFPFLLISNWKRSNDFSGTISVTSLWHQFDCSYWLEGGDGFVGSGPSPPFFSLPSFPHGRWPYTVTHNLINFFQKIELKAYYCCGQDPPISSGKAVSLELHIRTSGELIWRGLNITFSIYFFFLQPSSPCQANFIFQRSFI